MRFDIALVKSNADLDVPMEKRYFFLMHSYSSTYKKYYADVSEAPGRLFLFKGE
ncbi:MAG: hypothetical protein WCY88_07285 [Spongiibacteraceae bacterium]